MMQEFWSRFHWIDLVILVIFIRTIYVGARRGFIPELTTLIGLAAALVISLQQVDPVSAFLSARVHLPEQWSASFSAVALFIATYLLFCLIRVGVGKLFQLQVASGLDRWGGVLMGMVRAAVISGIIFSVLAQAPSQSFKAGIEERSLTASYLAGIGSKIREVGSQWRFQIPR